MNDPILLARLDALEENLKYVNPISGSNPQVRWRSDYGLEVTRDEEVWNYLATGISRKVVHLFGVVADIRRELAAAVDTAGLASAWGRYSRVYEESQEIFGECLELLGGLTFREKVEEKLFTPIFGYADALIRDYARRTTRGKSLAVPASREALKRTLGRIIRLRYPEWTVWSLPLTAHEYGHVLEDRPADLLALVPEWVAGCEREEAQRRPNQDTEAVRAAATRRAMAHLQVYWADAFATYVSGPAYPWAYLFLRFNPGALPGPEELPCEEGRLRVILAILARLDRMVTGMHRPYEAILQDLEQKAREILERAPPAHLLEAGEKAVLDAIADALWGKLTDEFPFARYPDAGWRTAEGWETLWRTQLESAPTTPKLGGEDVVGLAALSDALNAAWLCRISLPNRTGQIAEAAEQLCGTLLEREQAASRNAISSRPQRG
jgi:hypothetical protein